MSSRKNGYCRKSACATCCPTIKDQPEGPNRHGCSHNHQQHSQGSQQAVLFQHPDSQPILDPRGRRRICPRQRQTHTKRRKQHDRGNHRLNQNRDGRSNQNEALENRSIFFSSPANFNKNFPLAPANFRSKIHFRKPRGLSPNHNLRAQKDQDESKWCGCPRWQWQGVR